MNCRDVTEILDNQKVGLDPAQRREVEAHVAACADCSNAWHLQTGLAALPNMTLPAGFANHCRNVVARGARSIPGRTGRRVLAGTLAALVAAAAIMALLQRPIASIGPAAAAGNAPAAHAEVAAPVMGLDSVELSPGTPQAIEVIAPTAPAFTVSVEPPRPVPAPGSSRMFSAEDDAALRAYQSSPPRKQAVQAFYSALLDELRRVPGLTLVEPDQPIADPAGKNYAVRFGFSIQIGLDGRVVPGDGRVFSLGVTAQQLKPDGQKVVRMNGGVTIDLLAPCAGTQPVADVPPCPDPRGMAAETVRKLRQEVFPPDASVIRPLQARLQDSSLDAAQRSKAFSDIFKLATDHDELGLLRDPGVVRAALALAADGDPAVRTQIWRMMRGVGNPALIPPMLDSLVHDPAGVRLAAIETLAGDYLGDPRVRAALAATAVEDPRPLVRAVADRGVSGEDSWRHYVATSLGDANRPAAQRVEALMYYLYPPDPTPGSPASQPDYWQILEQLDDKSVSALAEALPNAGKPEWGNVGLLVSNFAGRNSKNPAVTEMLLGYLEHDPQPRMRIIAGQTLARTQAGNSRVREALTKAIQTDPDPRVRDQILQTMPPSGGNPTR